MKKVLMLSIVFLFFVGSVNADEYVRDDDSYYIHFAWSGGRPLVGKPGGFLFLDAGHISLIAARTREAFNVYAKNNSPDAETGAPIEEHTAWPIWYWGDPEVLDDDGYGWDTPDASPLWNCDVAYECNAPFYLLTIDTYQGKWWLFYTQYPNQPSTAGIANLYVPMSGKINDVEFNGNGTIDIDIEDEGNDWKTFWGPGALENIKLQDGHFVVHIDPVTKTGYMAPRQLLTKVK